MQESQATEDSDIKNFLPATVRDVNSTDISDIEPLDDLHYVEDRREITNTAVHNVTRASASEQQIKSRTAEYVRRREYTEVFFPVMDIEQALMRTGIGNEVISDLINIIKVGRQNVFPPGFVIEKKGKRFLNLAVLSGEDPELLE